MSVTDNVYATDDYPREGCSASVDVLASGYRLSIRDPNGRLLEGYAVVKSTAAISRMLREWCDGKRPKIKGDDE